MRSLQWFGAALAVVLAGPVASAATIEVKGCDSAAVAAAIEVAGPGDTVQLPEGTIVVRETIRPKSGIKLLGAGQEKTRLVYEGAKPGVVIRLSACEDVEIAQLTVDGRNNPLVHQGIAGASSRRVWLHHLTVRNLKAETWGPHAILFSGRNPTMEGGVTDSRITDCRIENIGLEATYGGGIRLAWGSVRNQVLGNTIHNTGRGGIFGDHSAELVIRNNRVSGSGGTGLGIEIWGGCPRSIIEDNVVDHWLSVDASDRTAVRRNVIGTDEGTLKGYGIEIIARDVVVTDNAVKRGAAIGLSVSNKPVKNNVFWGYNTISECAQWGAQFQGESGGIARHYLYRCTFEKTLRGDARARYPQQSGHGFRTNGACRDMVFEECALRDNGGCGLQLGGRDVDRLAFLRCAITGNGLDAVSGPAPGAAIEFKDCKVEGNRSDRLPQAPALPGTPPEADFRAPAVVRAGVPVEFQCASRAPGGTIAERLWDFNDGIPEVEASPRHTFERPGRYRVTLVTWDAAGRGARAEKTIDVQPARERLSLWPARAPLGDGRFETAEASITVHRPPPEQANGAALVICPGGGYGGLVTDAEGHGIAAWLNEHGIAGVVLEYRLPKGRTMVPLLDAQRAIRMVRSHAKQWNIDPARIGITGFSAGGHLASTAATHFDGGDPRAADPVDRVSCRPDFAVLVYPVVTMGEKTHRGSKKNLLGPDPKPDLVELFSNEKQVTPRTPPMFLAHAKDDKAVVPDNSRMLYEALRAHKVRAEYLELPSGGHGLNGYKGPMWDAWQKRSLEWLAAEKFIPQRGAASTTSPNVLIIMCDQLTAGVLGCYGGPLPTPHVDRLAREGVCFRSAICTTPFCSPTRASIITGLYPHTHGIVYNANRRDYPAIEAPPTEEGIKAADTTTEKILFAAGYSTHHYGKWHLMDEDLPYYTDMYGEHHEYAAEEAETFRAVRQRAQNTWMNWYEWALPVDQSTAFLRAVEHLGGCWEGQRHAEFVVRMGRLALPAAQHFDVRTADKTVERIAAPRQGPFMITCSFNAPHDPNVVPSPYYEKFDPAAIRLPANRDVREPRYERDWSRRIVADLGEPGLREFLRIYYASVKLVDDQVGRILAALERAGVLDKTVIVFTADHGDMAGGHGMVWKSNGSFYDEIARVPLLVRYPPLVKPQSSDLAVDLTDLMPTLLEIVGQPIPPQAQGQSLVPYLTGRADPGTARPYAFCERVTANAEHSRQVKPGTRASFMVRGQGWKYWRHPNGEEYLYHLAADPGETRNLAADKACQTRKNELIAALEAWLNRTGYSR